MAKTPFLLFPALSSPSPRGRAQRVRQSPIWCPEGFTLREAGEAPSRAPPAAGSASRVGGSELRPSLPHHFPFAPPAPWSSAAAGSRRRGGAASPPPPPPPPPSASQRLSLEAAIFARPRSDHALSHACVAPTRAVTRPGQLTSTLPPPCPAPSRTFPRPPCPRLRVSPKFPLPPAPRRPQQVHMRSTYRARPARGIRGPRSARPAEATPLGLWLGALRAAPCGPGSRAKAFPPPVPGLQAPQSIR